MYYFQLCQNWDTLNPVSAFSISIPKDFAEAFSVWFIENNEFYKNINLFSELEQIKKLNNVYSYGYNSYNTYNDPFDYKFNIHISIADFLSFCQEIYKKPLYNDNDIVSVVQMVDYKISSANYSSGYKLLATKLIPQEHFSISDPLFNSKLKLIKNYMEIAEIVY